MLKFRWPWIRRKKKAQSQTEDGAPPRRKRRPQRPHLQLLAERTEKLRIKTDYLKAQTKFEEYKQHLEEAKRGESDKDDLHIELGDLRRIDKMLRPLGMGIKTEKGGDALEDENGFSKILKGIAKNIGAGAAAVLLEKQEAMTAGLPVQTYAPPQLPPAPVATISPPVAEAPALEQQIAPPEAGNMTLIAQYARASLENKDPEQAARWLLSQNREEARQLVRMLCTMEDEQLAAALNQVEQKYPDLAALVQWLRSRPQWTLDTVHAVRRLAPSTEQKVTSMGL